MDETKFSGSNVQQCGKRFADPQERPLDSRLPKEKVLLIPHCLVEGNSIRSTARIADVEKRTVMNLMLRIANDS
jgi:transposase-like protein